MSGETTLFSIDRRVRDEWIDYNNHMGVAYYSQLFDQCAEAFYEYLGLGETAARAGNGSLFSLEHHTCFLREILPDTPVRITLQLLDWDEKRIHYFMRMTDLGTNILAATSEQLAIHVDMGERASSPLSDHARTTLEALWPVHQTFMRPRQAGHIIKIPRKRMPKS